MEVVMRQLYLLAAAAPALITGFLFFSAATRADTLSCSSVNGVTQCIGSDGLDCRTIEGQMVCAPGAKGRCETAAGVTTCTNGTVRQSFRTGSQIPVQRNRDAEK
jgi:hypothetical protein